MMKYWMFVAVAAMGMISCSEDKSESNIPAPELPMVTMTVTAEDVEADDSRTSYDEAAGKARWENTGEKICVWQSIDAADATKAESAEAVVTDGKAAFTLQFTEASGTEFAYNAVYPSSAVVENSNLVVSKLKLITPAVQTSTATSFDGAADLLIAQPKSFEAQPTELSLAFKRVVAVGKMTLKNIATEDAILSVTFSSTDKVLAGRSYFDATTGEVVEYGYNSASDLLTINFEGGLTNVKEGTPIFFTALPCAIAGGESFTVTVSTAKQKFTRTVTLPEGAQSIAFNAGRISSFSVNMASADVSEITSLEGEYAVMAENSTKIFLMGNQTGSVLTSNEDATLSAIPEQYKYLDESLVWTVVAGENEGQYYLQQKSSGKYVSWSSGNTAGLATTPYALTIEKKENGTYEVFSAEDGTRKLQYNKTSPRFVFYATEQTPIYLVPATPNTTPTLTVVAQPAMVAAEGAEVVEVALTTANLTEEIEVTVDYTDSEGWISNVAVAADKLTFTVAENTTEEERTATITLSANGVEDTVNVTQSGKAPAGEETAGWHKESWSNFSGTESYVSGSVEGDLGTWSYVGCSAYEQNTTKLTGYISMSSTSKSAKITSPTFENGIGGIKFNYYVNNTARKFKVTVYEKGVAVKTETITPTAKTTVLSYEITVTTTGSTYFVFEPTTDSNRVSIGEVQVYY